RDGLTPEVKLIGTHPWDVSPANKADSYVRIADSSLDFRIGEYCGVFGDLMETFGEPSVSKVPMARPAIMISLLLTLNFVNMAQTPQTPNMEAQRTAMKKLDFLVGEWSGQASLTRGGVVIELEQSEVAQFK